MRPVLEGLARGFECPGRAASRLAPCRDRSHSSSPMLGVDRDAGAKADMADPDIAELDLPPLTAGSLSGRRGEGGHAVF